MLTIEIQFLHTIVIFYFKTNLSIKLTLKFLMHFNSKHVATTTKH